MTATTDVRHEVEVDTRISIAHEAVADARQRCHWAWQAVVGSLPRAQRGEFDDEVRFGGYDYAPAKVLEAAHAYVATGEFPRETRESLSRYYLKAQILTGFRDAQRAVEEEYGGWSRFFLVTSSAHGHVHSSMGCSSCNRRTGFAWLPDLSGLDEEAAVEAHGAILCTVCYPSAPLHWTDHYEAEEARKQAEACPGSGSAGAEGGSRQGYVSGNYHTCTVCGTIVGGAGRNVRKHKPGSPGTR
jgi:hypothetical protein